MTKEPTILDRKMVPDPKNPDGFVTAPLDPADKFRNMQRRIADRIHGLKEGINNLKLRANEELALAERLGPRYPQHLKNERQKRHARWQDAMQEKQRMEEARREPKPSFAECIDLGRNEYREI